MAVRELEPLTLATARVLGSVVVQIQGELDAYSVPTLESLLADLIEGQGNLSVVLDLAGMTFIDSSGVRAFVRALKAVRRKGGTLRLSAPTPATWRVLEILGVDKLFEITTL